MTRDVEERELQFEAADIDAVDRWIRSQPRHAQLTFRAGSDKVQNDVYFDTEDWALFRAGYSLRVRRKGDAGEATLKALSKSKGGLASRREITQVLPHGDAGLDGSEGDVSNRVRLVSAGRPLRPLFEIVNRRRTIDIEHDTANLAEISLDDAQVLVDGTSRRSFSRVEVEETTAGGLEAASSFIDALQAAFDLVPAEKSKFEIGLESAELQPSQVFNFGYRELSPESTTGEYAYALLRRLFSTMLNHEPGTRLGEDPEELHDMRVATRRMRAAMSTFRPALPGRFEKARAELKWIAACLGEVRDVEVQLEWLDEMQRTSSWEDATAVGPLIEERRERWALERTRLLEALDSERYHAMAEELAAILREGDPGQGQAAMPVKQFGRRVLKKRRRQFRREAEDLTSDSDPHLYHLARIRGKKLRYASEALTDVFGEPAVGLVTAIKHAQDVLGEHQDKAVAITWLRLTALSDRAWPPLTLVRLGELTEGCRHRMAELRAEWPETYANVEKAWKPLRRSFRRGRPEHTQRSSRNDAVAPQEQAVQRPLSIFRRWFRGRPGEAQE